MEHGDWLIDFSLNWLFAWLLDWFVDLSIHSSIDWLLDYLIDSLIYLLIDWLIGTTASFSTFPLRLWIGSRFSLCLVFDALTMSIRWICRTIVLLHHRAQRNLIQSSPLRRSFASALDIPVPRLKNPIIPTDPTDGVRYVEGLNRRVRVSSWGRQPDRPIVAPSQPSPRFQMRDVPQVISTNKTHFGRVEVSPDQFQRVGVILESYGMARTEIEQNPGIFAVPTEELEDNLEVLKECGWETFTTDMVIYNWILMTKLSAMAVISSDNFSVSRSVLRNLLTELGVDETAQQRALNSVTESAASYLVSDNPLPDWRVWTWWTYFSDPIVHSIEWLIDWLFDWSIDWSIDGWMDGLIDWLIDWLIA